MKLRILMAVAIFAAIAPAGVSFSQEKPEQTPAEYKAQSEALIKRLHRFRFPSQNLIKQSHYELHPMVNPFYDRKDEIRNIKRTSANVSQMWDRLEPLAREYKRFNDQRDIALGAMLVVAAFYDYGNPPPDDSKAGCVSINKSTGYKPLPALTFLDHSKSEIGCCTDFALLLTSFLTRLGVQNEILHSKVHQTTRVNIDGKWSYLDSNSLMFIEGYFDDGEKDLYYFTPYDGARLDIFQQFLMKAMMFNEPYYTRADWNIVKTTDHYAKMQATYLLDAETN